MRVRDTLIPFLRHTLRDLQKARKAFKDVQSCHLAIDYPEPVYEAWIGFEETWGTAKDLQFALKRVCKMASALSDKRSKVCNFVVPESVLARVYKCFDRMYTKVPRFKPKLRRKLALLWGSRTSQYPRGIRKALRLQNRQCMPQANARRMTNRGRLARNLNKVRLTYVVMSWI